jgi:hypothetical protein
MQNKKKIINLLFYKFVKEISNFKQKIILDFHSIAVYDEELNVVVGF